MVDAENPEPGRRPQEPDESEETDHSAPDSPPPAELAPEGSAATDPSDPEPTSAQNVDVTGQPTVQRVKVRRAPNITSFVLTGAVLGFILGALVNQFGPFGDAEAFPFQITYSDTTSLLYLATIGALFGIGIGALVAVLLDRRD